jgi:hypothetical protein
MFLSSRKYDPGCSSRIRILIFYPSQIPDPGVKKGTRSRIRIRKTDRTLSFLVSRVAWRFLMEGFVSKARFRRFFFELAMAAAAATPTGPAHTAAVYFSFMKNFSWVAQIFFSEGSCFHKQSAFRSDSVFLGRSCFLGYHFFSVNIFSRVTMFS